MIEKNLRRYLETEGLLNAFFSAWGYCVANCIQPEMLKNGNKPVAACCSNKYYALYDLDHPAFERLKEEREKLFGKPEDHRWKNPVTTCEYHNPENGCLLSTHKSPICLAYVCQNGIACLRSRYGIYAYDYLGVNYALEWILTGDFNEKQYCEFRDSILDMIEKVSEP